MFLFIYRVLKVLQGDKTLVDEKITISPTVKTAFQNFRTAVKRLPHMQSNKSHKTDENDAYMSSGEDPLPPDKRLRAAATKLNAENELTLAVVTNYCAELDNNLNLPQMYSAYQNYKLDDLELTPTSENTVQTSYKGKQIEIKYSLLDDGSKQYEINYEDGSKVKYVSFAQGSKMEINGEEFEMPQGAVLEEKSIPGKVFSKLIQTPDMRRNFINMPDILNEAEQTLKTNNSV